MAVVTHALKFEREENKAGHKGERTETRTDKDITSSEKRTKENKERINRAT